MTDEMPIHLYIPRLPVNWNRVNIAALLYQIPQSDSYTSIQGKIYDRRHENFLDNDADGVILVCENPLPITITCNLVMQSGGQLGSPIFSYPIGIVEYMHRDEDNHIAFDLKIPDLQLNMGTFADTKSIRKSISYGMVPGLDFLCSVSDPKPRKDNPRYIDVSSIKWHALVMPEFCRYYERRFE